MNDNAFFSDAFVRAAGWTLVHSLWQGAAAALLLFALLYRLQTARQRYRAAYGMLLAMLAAAVATFVCVYQPVPDGAGDFIAMEGDAVSASYFIGIQAIETDMWQRLSGWLEARHPLIVAVWLLGFAFFLLRFAGGLWQVNRLGRRGVRPADAHWEEKMAELGARLGMTRPVRLLESALVHAPLTIGWLKPLVLLPVGLVNRLSPAEVEAILAHELAHIARRDWLFNLVQAFIETLFYYHPAVWWMSQVVCRERENCCDDDALAATGNRLAFAKALVQVQEMAKPLPALALGIQGATRRPMLLERIRRILNQPQHKSHIMEKITATLILFALLTLVGIRANNATSLSSAFAQISDIPAAIFGAEDNAVENDSLPKPKSIRKITREDDKQRIEAEYRDNELTRLSIDGKEIPTSEFDRHRDLTNELLRDIPAPAPPAPPMPPGFYFAPKAPAAGSPVFPAPPAPPVPPRFSVTKDEDGSPLIVFERDGEPVEMKVKDGQVWIDGKLMADGESMEVPGLGNGYFYWNGEDGNTFHFTPAEGFYYFDGMLELDGLEGLQHIENLDEFPHFRLSDEEKARLEEESERLRGEARRLAEESRQLSREQKRTREKEMKQVEKDMKVQRKEWEKEQKRWEKEQEKWALEQERWAQEQERWGEGQERYAREMAKADALNRQLKTELRKDGLIGDPGNFQFQLSAKELKINGKKQPDQLHRKYLELYRTKSGKEMGKNDSMIWTESN
jgi:beta-lactamase regulating signal transducer with metallopeptidase domain